jgi:hypothetical protein
MNAWKSKSSRETKKLRGDKLPRLPKKKVRSFIQSTLLFPSLLVELQNLCEDGAPVGCGPGGSVFSCVEKAPQHFPAWRAHRIGSSDLPQSNKNTPESLFVLRNYHFVELALGSVFFGVFLLVLHPSALSNACAPSTIFLSCI